MITIFKFLDYRDYLKWYYTSMKGNNSWFSYRYIARKVEMDASHLVKIIQKKRHIAHSSIEKFISLCSLRKKEAEYFRALVRFNKAKSKAEEKEAYEQLLSLKDIKQLMLKKDRYEYYSGWYHSAVLTLLHMFPFADNYAALGRMLTPPISGGEAKKSVELLKRLKLIEKNPDGSYSLTNTFLTSDPNQSPLQIRNYQAETMKLASESLYNHSREIRNISTVTVTLKQEDMDKIDEMITRFRTSILKFVKNTDEPDTVYQLNIQLFPLSHPVRKKKGGGKQ